MMVSGSEELSDAEQQHVRARAATEAHMSTSPPHTSRPYSMSLPVAVTHAVTDAHATARPRSSTVGTGISQLSADATAVVTSSALAVATSSAGAQEQVYQSVTSVGPGVEPQMHISSPGLVKSISAEESAVHKDLAASGIQSQIAASNDKDGSGGDNSVATGSRVRAVSATGVEASTARDVDDGAGGLANQQRHTTALVQVRNGRSKHHISRCACYCPMCTVLNAVLKVAIWKYRKKLALLHSQPLHLVKHGKLVAWRHGSTKTEVCPGVSL